MRVCSSSFYFYYNFNLKCNFLVPTNNNNFALSLSLSLYYALNFSLTYTIFANILALTLKYKCSYCNNVKSFCSLTQFSSVHIFTLFYMTNKESKTRHNVTYVRIVVVAHLHLANQQFTHINFISLS